MHQSRNLIIGPPAYLQTFSYPRRGRKCFLVVPRAAAEHWSNSPPFLEGPSGLWGSGADFQTAGDRFRQFRLDGHLGVIHFGMQHMPERVRSEERRVGKESKSRG